MKLLTKTSLNFISVSLFFFLFGSLGGYYFIRYSVNKNLNLQLLESKDVVIKHLTNNNANPTLTFANVRIDTLTNDETLHRTPIYKDTAYNDYRGEIDLYRLLTCDVMVNNQPYRITILQSTAPSDMLVMKFTFMLATFPVIFFLILFFVNRHSIKKSLSVFYDTINKLKTFDVNTSNQLKLMASDVDEFEILNEVFNAMELKIKKDYIRLKEYTENTSHELQTPLAILSSRLEELLQSGNLNEVQIKTIAGLIETTSRISRINQALIFLAKIDNRHFEQSDNVNIKNEVEAIVEHLKDLWEEKELKISQIFKNDLIVNVNQSLIHTLIQNLIKNAIKHNIANGFIHIEIENNEMTISNSGEPLEFEADEAFSRYKSREHHLSMGIGLSIAKRISEISNIDLSYQNENTNHQIKLIFNCL